MKYLDRDELLSKLGLERKPSAGEWLMGALAPFGVGMLVGAGIALLLAPKSGRELREGIRHRVRREQISSDEDRDSEFESKGRSAV
jgi:gas vesicle protein